MRASTSACYRVGDPALYAMVQRLEGALAANGADEIGAISIYFTPRAQGKEIAFHTPAGEAIEHIRIDPVASREFLPSRGIRILRSGKAKAEAAPPRAVTPGWALGDVGYLRDKWRLTNAELLALLDVSEERMKTLADVPEARLTNHEHERLTTLHEINKDLQDVLHGRPVADWLRSDCTMLQYVAPTPLAQLLTYGSPAIELMKEALRHYFLMLTHGPYPGDLRPGFDTLLHVHVEWPIEWEACRHGDD
jgi:hypothetical protein